MRSHDGVKFDNFAFWRTSPASVLMGASRCFQQTQASSRQKAPQNKERRIRSSIYSFSCRGEAPNLA